MSIGNPEMLTKSDTSRLISLFLCYNYHLHLFLKQDQSTYDIKIVYQVCENAYKRRKKGVKNVRNISINTIYNFGISRVARISDGIARISDNNFCFKRDDDCGPKYTSIDFDTTLI